MIWFFRDVLDGMVYFLYLVGCILAFFYVLGIIGDRKRKMIEAKLRDKKKYDIESGREAMIAAMETKQVLDVDDTQDKFVNDPTAIVNQNATLNSALNSMSNMPDATEAQKDDVPNVMVLDSGSTSDSGNNEIKITPPLDSSSSDGGSTKGPIVINTSGIEK